MLFWMLLLACASVDAPDTEYDSEDSPPGTDGDGDGVGAEEDCDDADETRYPGAPERCNGVDDDCDGEPAAGEQDGDQDGELDCALCEEGGYFSALAGVSDQDLWSALHEASGEVSCTYSSAREWMFTVLDDQDGSVECVYTGQMFEIADYPPDWDVVNTEHTWPQSEGADLDPMQCDLHHLFPSDADANTRRGSLPFGEVDDIEWSDGGSLQGTDSSGDDVFEPRDSHKGNVARSMLYFAVRYGYEPPHDQLSLQVFTSWHEQDPPDEPEIERTLRIRDRQGNANPFVVCDGLYERVTGY